jgi:hypothetical protein
MPDNNGSDLRVLISALLGNRNFKRKLEVYADRLLNKWTKYNFARHILPDDLISSVTLKLLEGDINWNSKTCSLPCFFYRRIRTEVFNLSKREIKFIPVQLENSESITDYEGEIVDDIPLPPQFIFNPFEDDNNEDEIDPEEFKKIAFGIFKDSDEEFCVLDEMFKGNKSNLIALKLGIPVKDVKNIKKRISRILEVWVLRNKTGKVPADDRTLINKTKRLINPFINKPGKITPDNNNNGELS